MSTLATGPTMRTERPREGGAGVSVPGVTAMEDPLSRCCESVESNVDTSHVGGKRYFGTALILLLSASCHGESTHDTATLDDGQRSCAGHDAAVARHDQAMKPRLPGDANQLVRELLEAGRRIGHVHGDLHRDS